MKYNILVVKNRYKKNPNFSKGLDWFKKNTPLEMIAEDHIETNFDVTTQKVGNGTYTGVVVGEDIIPKLRTVVPQGKYHAVVLLYGNELDGIRLNIANNVPIWPGTYLVQLCKDTDKGKTLNHELFHTFFHRLRAQGINLTDPMDIVYYNGGVIEYFNNDNLDANPSNRSIAIATLAPHWEKVSKIVASPVVPTPPASTDTYKYFKMTEKTDSAGKHTFSELAPEFRSLLDKMRGECGFPWVINSGYRTSQENGMLADSVSDSAHVSRLAADIQCTDSAKRDKIVIVAKANGVRRIGIGKTFVHLDIDKSKPQDVMWHYY